MADYDFTTLSALEFEEIVRDLLQVELSIKFESFTSGKDSGIDFRCARDGKNGIIIQCKRYSNYNDLKKTLKNEKSKLDILLPKRYILATSLGLTPLNKDEIMGIVSPYIKSSSDIVTRQDLNNWLSKHKDIEIDHFKLWLSSTSILKRILHSRVHNQSRFEKDTILSSVNRYVKNSSFQKAVAILNKESSLIISGTPGIGKTTLARIVSLHYLGQGYEEFIYISESIVDAWSFFETDKKQVFLFDDFLGRNFLEPSLKTNEDAEIIKFMEAVQRSKNKIFIMTTREYILQQARNKFENFNKDVVNLSKFILDISDYSKLNRARILYNHIYFSDLDQEEIRLFLNGDLYLRIINHSNYNPRTIESITNRALIAKFDKANFARSVMSFLDNPEHIWKHAFESQISDMAKCLLALCYTAGFPILKRDLLLISADFFLAKRDSYQVKHGFHDLMKGLRELEGSFVNINYNKDVKDYVIDIINPSVADFLLNHFQENPIFFLDIISVPRFINQITNTAYLFRGSGNRSGVGKIQLLDSERDGLVKLLVDKFDEFSFSTLVRMKNKSSDFSWIRKSASIFNKIEILFWYANDQPLVRSLIVEKVKRLVREKAIYDNQLSRLVQIFSAYQDELRDVAEEALVLLSNNVKTIDSALKFQEFKDFYPEEFECLPDWNSEYPENIYIAISEDIDNITDSSDLSEKIGEIQEIGLNIGFDCSELEIKLKKKIADYEEYLETLDPSDYYDDWEEPEEPDSDLDIENMFSTIFD